MSRFLGVHWQGSLRWAASSWRRSPTKRGQESRTTLSCATWISSPWRCFIVSTQRRQPRCHVFLWEGTPHLFRPGLAIVGCSNVRCRQIWWSKPPPHMTRYRKMKHMQQFDQEFGPSDKTWASLPTSEHLNCPSIINAHVQGKLTSQLRPARSGSLR